MKKAVLKSDLTGNTKIDAILQKYRFGVPAGEVEKMSDHELVSLVENVLR